MTSFWVLLVSVSILLVPQDSHQQQDQQRQHQFSLNEPLISLARRISLAPRSSKNDNLIMSPMSIMATLNLLLLGSGGNTYEQLRYALQYPFSIDDLLIHQMAALQLQRLLSDQQSHQDTQLDIVTKLFADSSFTVHKWFRENALLFYRTAVTELQFGRRPGSATQQINRWINNATRGKIPELFAGTLPRNTRMIAANAVYFNGTWEKPFSPSYTRMLTFHLDESSHVKTPVMYGDMALPYVSFHDQGFSAVSLPYKGGRFSMLVLLPDLSGVEHIDRLEANLTAEKILHIVQMQEKTQIQIWLPKFRHESTISLREHLQNMGCTDIFQESRAQLNRLSPDLALSVSAIEHKALIEVDERGTEAAAVTITLVNRNRFVIPFRATRPFIYIIRDNLTSVPLFYGRFVTP